MGGEGRDKGMTYLGCMAGGTISQGHAAGIVAVMGMLVVYCLKGVTPLSGNHGIPELAAVLLTVGLHKWKHNTLLSILGGTICYMIFIQCIF